MSSLPKVGDTFSEQFCLYFSPQHQYLSIQKVWAGLGPQYVPCCAPFTVTATVARDPLLGAVASFELAKQEALRQYTERVAAINEMQARYLAIEAASNHPTEA